eukprot:CAMPEP_0116849342 /NCGR_PEP_ID=MMETSP0418-20121206/15518_1 /TAXON_ID=1158023 /ORGANISM="Astrosyne radiata, Strain 13vi08-1A" /LENGTH=675 /DNA_ID=CAMNT_0004481051 /DNA_START=6 /DNA_END=2034 /DNA_ORIENTATION=+
MDFIKDLTIDNLRNAAEDAFNQAKPKSEYEARVYEVLSHKNWGSSSTLMNEIARDSFDYDKYPKTRRVKGLTLLEHLVKNGSERCVDDARNHSHALRSLFQFNYYEGTVDRGLGVREKSKQIVELLGDDERIREERQKARKLREKFGGNLGGVSNSSGGGGGYGGYGNEGGKWGESGGYGDSGIGSTGFQAGGGGGGSGGGGSGGNGYGGDSGGFSGRYSDDQETRASSSAAAPTFATLPEEAPKKKSTKTKKSKKKKKDAESVLPPAPAAAPAAKEPANDLLSWDAAPAPAPTPAAGEDNFAAFQSATPAAAAPAAAASAQFDAFGNNQPQQQAAQFDAFGTGIGAGGGMPTMNTAETMNIGAMNNMFGNMGISQGQPSMNQGGMAGGVTSNVMSGGMGNGSTAAAPAPAADDGDDFGDFEDAAPKKAATSTSSDPMSRLISLDGLEKNKKKEDKLSQPILATPAAAQYMETQKYMQSQGIPVNAGPNPEMSFKGIDGLGGMGASAPTGMATPLPTGTQQQGQAAMASNVMGPPTAGGADAIAMMSPEALMAQPKPQQTPKTNMVGGQAAMTPQQMQQMQMMMSQQMQMMNQGMGGMNATPAGMGNMGMMNPQTQAMGQQTGGGMMNPNMQFMQMGGMGMVQQGGMMGGQSGAMGGQGGGAGNQMGGQPMAGWR